MADLTYTNDATERRGASGVSSGQGLSNTVKCLVSTVELAASASGTTVKFGTIPSSARILAASRVYVDDLATSGSPTLDLGLGSVNSNVTSDPDAIGNGLSLSAASNDNLAISDIANAGLPAWDFVNGQTSDPGGDLDVYGSVKDAATTQTGTITLELLYSLD